ncbi:hypothetical protein [Bosea lupini]|nr:hypothetical protein [Bosea lupini]
MSYAMGNMLVLDDGSRWGPFTSHWAAVAAMLRLGDREFTSLGDDDAYDLLIERDVRMHVVQIEHTRLQRQIAAAEGID